MPRLHQDEEAVIIHLHVFDKIRLPADVQKQIEGEKIELLDWVNENLEETYVHEANGEREEQRKDFSSE